MRHIHKTVNAKLSTSEDEPGSFSALVSVFDVVDSDGEIVPKGAFADGLASQTSYPVVFSHQWLKGPPIGILTASEIDEGLLVKGRFFVADGEHSQLARETFTAMKAGALTNWSFGASVAEERTEMRDGKEVNVLTKLGLIEAGPCLVGSNPETRTLSIKAAKDFLEEVEKDDISKSDDTSQEKAPDPTENKQITMQDRRALVDVLLNIGREAK